MDDVDDGVGGDEFCYIYVGIEGDDELVVVTISIWY